MGVIISIYTKLDQIMIKEMMGTEAVGQYAAAVRISEAWYFIPMVIASSLFPAIINGKKQSEAIYHTRLQNLYDLMVWMAIAIALPMTFMSDWVINLLYGAQYNQAGGVLMIHIWTGLNLSIGMVWGKWIISENKQIISLYGYTLGIFVNVFLNYLLIKEYGIQGAAFATLITHVSISILVYLFYKPKVTFSFLFKSFFILLKR